MGDSNFEAFGFYTQERSLDFGERMKMFIEGYFSRCEAGGRVSSRKLIHGVTEVSLYVIEEDVDSCTRVCNHCVSAGWGTHILSKWRYHFVIPREDTRLDLESSDHRLHGLVHGNGVGHLVRVQSSTTLHICDTMNLWERMCWGLQVRKVSVRDDATKGDLDLRLLYGIGWSSSWFRQWGYEFCRGSFGVDPARYKAAIDEIGSIPLRDFAEDQGDEPISKLVAHYASMSKANLTTLKDLMGFLLTGKRTNLIQQNREAGQEVFQDALALAGKVDVPDDPFGELTKNIQPAHRLPEYKNIIDVPPKGSMTKEKIKSAAELILEVLKEARKDGHCELISEQIKAGCHPKQKDRALISYVLSQSPCEVGEYVICRVKKQNRRGYDYHICKLSQEGLPPLEPTEGSDMYNDLSRLYHHVMLKYNDAAQVILKSKIFVKEPALVLEENTFVCHLLGSSLGIDDQPVPPGDIVSVPAGSKNEALKEAAQKKFRETYCILKSLNVDKISSEDGPELVMTEKPQAGKKVFVSGTGADLSIPVRFEGGLDYGNVNCKCGTRTRDGEDMLECRNCHNLQHRVPKLPQSPAQSVL